MWQFTLCHLNLCIKKWRSLSWFRRRRPFISLNSSVFIEIVPSSNGGRTDHVKKKKCAERMRGAIELNHLNSKRTHNSRNRVNKENSVSLLSFLGPFTLSHSDFAFIVCLSVCFSFLVTRSVQLP